MHNVILASAASTAGLTMGLVGYATLIFISLAMTIYYARRNRRGQATAAAVVVGVLTVGGLVVAILSSIA